MIMSENEKKVVKLYEEIQGIVDSDDALWVTSFMAIHGRTNNCMLVTRRSSSTSFARAIVEFRKKAEQGDSDMSLEQTLREIEELITNGSALMTETSSAIADKEDKLAERTGLDYDAWSDFIDWYRTPDKTGYGLHIGDLVAYRLLVETFRTELLEIEAMRSVAYAQARTAMEAIGELDNVAYSINTAKARLLNIVGQAQNVGVYVDEN